MTLKQTYQTSSLADE